MASLEYKVLFISRFKLCKYSPHFRTRISFRSAGLQLPLKIAITIQR